MRIRKIAKNVIRFAKRLPNRISSFPEKINIFSRGGILSPSTFNEKSHAIRPAFNWDQYSRYCNGEIDVDGNEIKKSLTCHYG